jgi:hypothetical protein
MRLKQQQQQKRWQQYDSVLHIRRTYVPAKENEKIKAIAPAVTDVYLPGLSDPGYQR